MKMAAREYIGNRTIFLLGLAFVCIAGGIGVIFPPHIYPLAAVLALMALVLMIYSPIAALLTYLVFFLAWPQEWAPYFQYLPGFTERIIGFMAMGSLALSMLARRRTDFHMGRIGLAFLGLLVAYTLSAFSAYYLTEVKDTVTEVLRLLVVYVLVVNIVDTPAKLKAVMRLYFLAVGVMAVLSVVNYYNGVFQYRMGIARAIGHGMSYADPNSHAATIIYALPVLFYSMKHWAKGIERIALVAISAVGCWNIVLTGSRTAMVGVLVLVAAVIARSQRKFVYGLLAAILLVAIAFAMPEQYKQRFESTADITSESSSAESARGRIEGLEHGFKLFLISPITGVGAGCFAIARGVEFGVYFSSHNMLAELMAESGVVGMSAFGVFVWAIFFTIRQLRRRLRTQQAQPERQLMIGLTEGILVSYWLLFLMGLAGHNLYRYNWFFFGAVLTAMLHMVELQDEPPPVAATKEDAGSRPELPVGVDGGEHD
ncbi:MAG: O-antigen ligase family protein [bacterium]